MPDLLLEFFSEEIPARMQARAADDLKKLVTDRLVAAGLTYDGATAFATPRRLTLAVQGVPARSPDIKDERKGPKVGAPEQAIAGFLRAAGLKSIDQAKVQADKKGDFYVAVIEKPGRPAIEVIAEIVPEVARAFPWPKSMRWGEQSGKGWDTARWGEDQWGGSLKWVRPLHSIVATFGPETEEPEVVPFRLDGVAAGDTTQGHRFMAPAPIRVKRLDDYVAQLEKAKVVVDPARRREIILADAKNLAFAQGYELIEDDGLLAEVAGLVEWPVVLMGSFDAAFLKIPSEVIRATIRTNQKCFVLRDPQSAKLTNKFIMVANIEASDQGKAIVAGCERVIRARLSDAKFFYETDLKTRLEDRLPKFEHIVFHEKLGTQGKRIQRIEQLADEIAKTLWKQRQSYFNGKFLSSDDLDDEQSYRVKVQRAARLCKTDLLTEVVGEFPELQGLMGKYYAEAQGEDEAVAHACEDHYSPKGPDDMVPADPVSVAVALADKIDTLAGFWTIAEKPTGSGDQYGLRRAALGVVRILARGIRLKLMPIFSQVVHGLVQYKVTLEPAGNALRIAPTIAGREIGHHGVKAIVHRAMGSASDLEKHEREKQEKKQEYARQFEGDIAGNLLSFFFERLKVQLRDNGARHDLVDAVLALGSQDDLLLIVRRVEALGKFLDTDDGKNLLAGYKRATNILRIEEKKDNKRYDNEEPKEELYRQEEERVLAKAIHVAKLETGAAVAGEDFVGAMSKLARVRPYVDAFFDKVTVNVTEGNDAEDIRKNRLRLLNEIREATRAVADFSKIEG